MLCSRVLSAAVLICSTAACGFQPLYAPPPAAADPAAPATPAPSAIAALSSVSVDRIPDRQGQQLRTQLSRLLGSESGSQPPRYRLAVKIKTESESLALRRTGLASRASLRMSAQYRLVDVASDEVVLRSAARGISSYNLLDQDFSTLTSLQDAQNRLLEQMALDIRNRLAVFFLAGPIATDSPVPADPESSTEHDDPAAPS
jgi:LPS-assembly lipoprotein